MKIVIEKEKKIIKKFTSTVSDISQTSNSDGKRKGRARK